MTDSSRKLAYDYFIFFAKFEYALKESGYFKNKAINKPAEADWNDYITSLSNLSLEELKEKCNKNGKYLLNNPPKQQVIKSVEPNILDWKEKRISCLCSAIYACTRVRNNLFHGGKCNDDYTKRNRKLILGAMNILSITLKHNADVKHYFGHCSINIDNI